MRHPLILLSYFFIYTDDRRFIHNFVNGGIVLERKILEYMKVISLVVIAVSLALSTWNSIKQNDLLYDIRVSIDKSR